jgi:thiol:disulfide interchange protein DsbC
MMKRTVFALIAALLAATACADEASLKKTIETAYPKIKVQSISKTPYAGLYEVFFDGQIFYTDEKFSFLIAEGRLVDTKTKRDVTSDRLEQLMRVDTGTLPMDKAIKVVKGDGSRKLVVFSDPDCPYCKQLEQKSLSAVNNVTIYTFLFPLQDLHPDAANKARAIWCAPDKGAAWQNWMVNGQLPQSAAENCNAPIQEITGLGRKLGISSTPTLVFANGQRVPGALPAEEVEKLLDAASRK